MDIDHFHTALEGLTRQQRRVLDKFLCGEKDQQIADALVITKTTVRKHIEAICKAFGFANLPGERLSKRLELISLFYKYKPELVQENIPIETQPAESNLPPLINEFLAYDSAWTGRNDLISDLSKRLQGCCRLLLLVGLTGIGKTALAERLSVELGNWFNHDPEKLCRKNFDHKLTPSDFVSVSVKWLEDSGETLSPEERKQPQSLLRRLVEYFCHHPQLVLIDSLEFLLFGDQDIGWSDFIDEWWCQFFASLLSAETCQSRFIITSQELPNQLVQAASRYPNFWHCQRVDGLTETEQVSLFDKVGLGSTLQSLEMKLLLRIGKAYKGHPLALRTIYGEIINDFASHVSAYWQQYGHEIKEVEKALAEASLGIVTSPNDQWKLDRYSVELRRKVQSRLEQTFKKLSDHAYHGYILLCTASVYREPVQKGWWLRHLEYRGYTDEQQKLALETLKDRYLIEISFDQNNGMILIGMHNLVRSVAINHRQKLCTQEA
ncbi:LuxR C-terminal-related transcriptional regulator [Anabaena catenula]|uniref:ATP-binding protein n=1 Tax=Anabaena catenula FACHB-362 TaxID=2692877 RepID=A0ABR8J1V8_9NOST|nr:ATP-binding protein [Anabaena catenula FACHB-362]